MKQWKYGLTIVTACAVCIAGCTSTFDQSLIRDELAMWSDEKIVSLTLDNGSVISFNEEGGRIVRKYHGSETITTIVGITNHDERVQIDLNTIIGAKIERTEFNGERSLLFSAALLSAVLFVGILIALSSI